MENPELQASGSDCDTCYEEIKEKTTLDLSSQDMVVMPRPLLPNGNCANLSKLYLDYNELTNLDGEALEHLNNLLILSVIGNQLEELPDNISSLSHLQELYVNENDLTSLPEGIVSLKDLKTLNVVGNQISSLPEKMGEMQALETFTADENRLKKLPASYGLLKNLRVSDISNNKLKELPANFGNLSSLQTLNVSNNKLANLPQSFGDLENLIELDLSANNLKCLPNSFKSHEKIKRLYVDNNNILQIPQWILNLPEAEELTLKDNSLKGTPFPESFGERNRKLQVFDIGGNFISHLPDSIGNLTDLRSMHLGSVIGELERRAFQNGNWITRLPESFGNMIMLTKLWLDENQLVELPDNFGKLVHLEFLDLGQNGLHELPDSFCDLRSLEVCQLSKNTLQYLPKEFGKLTALIDLRLDNNLLSELPESMENLVNLKSLDLFNNHLPQVPPFVQALKCLKRFDIDENKLRGRIESVPQIVTRNMYPSRNPEFKDNWRGRARQDLTNFEVTQVSEDTEDESENDQSSSSEEDTGYNELLFKMAAERNLSQSLWRSHTGPAKREVYVRPPIKKVINAFQRDWFEDDEDDEEDHLDGGKTADCNSSVGSAGDSGAISGLEEGGDLAVHENGFNNDDEEEDWDKEIEAMDPYGNQQVNAHKINKFYYPVVTTTNESGIIDHTYVPSEIHANPIIKGYETSGPEDGQFEDADSD